MSEVKKEDYEEPRCVLCMDETDITPVPVDRIISKLDSLYAVNNYAEAEGVLSYWLKEAENGKDKKGMLTLLEESIGYYRKQLNEERTVDAANRAIKLVDELGLQDTVSGATALLNAATGLKAFGWSLQSLSQFERAKKVYESKLDGNDARLAGLNNNMALCLVDMERYDEALDCYNKAIEILEKNTGKELDIAITYLNIASLLEAENGNISKKEIMDNIHKAKELIETPSLPRDSYYAFVCSKTYDTFIHYGLNEFGESIKKLSDEIYGEKK